MFKPEEWIRDSLSVGRKRVGSWFRSGSRGGAGSTWDGGGGTCEQEARAEKSFAH